MTCEESGTYRGESRGDGYGGVEVVWVFDIVVIILL